MWARVLSVFAVTTTCLFGGNYAIARPMMEVRLQGSPTNEKFLYHTGAQISLMRKKTFRKIKKSQRPKKLDLNLATTTDRITKKKDYGPC